MPPGKGYPQNKSSKDKTVGFLTRKLRKERKK